MLEEKEQQKPDIDWAVAQFNHLAGERNLFHRYMWQLPIGTFGAIGILLNAMSLFFKEGIRNLAIAIMVLCGFVCIYAALMLGRLHERLNARGKKLRILEEKMGDFSVITSSGEKHEEKIAKWFGKLSTTYIGIVFLILVGLVFLVWALFF